MKALWEQLDQFLLIHHPYIRTTLVHWILLLCLISGIPILLASFIGSYLFLGLSSKFPIEYLSYTILGFQLFFLSLYSYKILDQYKIDNNSFIKELFVAFCYYFSLVLIYLTLSIPLIIMNHRIANIIQTETANSDHAKILHKLNKTKNVSDTEVQSLYTKYGFKANDPTLSQKVGEKFLLFKEAKKLSEKNFFAFYSSGEISSLWIYWNVSQYLLFLLFPALVGGFFLLKKPLYPEKSSILFWLLITAQAFLLLMFLYPKSDSSPSELHSSEVSYQNLVWILIGISLVAFIFLVILFFIQKHYSIILTFLLSLLILVSPSLIIGFFILVLKSDIRVYTQVTFASLGLSLVLISAMARYLEKLRYLPQKQRFF